MGFDCTLHIIDEQQIKAAFSKRPFDPANWSPVEWCNDAVRLAAETLPYHYERNFALALWPVLWEEEFSTPAPGFPAWIEDSAESNPAALFETLPQNLRDQLPTTFEGNFSTGIFIPSTSVPETLAWVESAIRPLAPNQKKRFQGLVNILTEAKRRRMAYWEACDLGLPIVNFRPAPDADAAPDQEQHQQRLSLPSKLRDVRAWMPQTNTLVLSHGNPAGTLFVDLSTWPPNIIHRSEYMLSPAQDPSTKTWTARVSLNGNWKLVSLASLSASQPLEGPLQFESAPPASAAEDDAGAILSEFLSFFSSSKKQKKSPTAAKPGAATTSATTDQPWFRAGDLHGFGPHTVLLPRENEQSVPAIRVNNQGPFRRIRGVPEPELVDTPSEPRDVTARGALTLRNGQGVLIWGGNGYALDTAGEAHLAYPLNARASSNDWSFATLGDAGFYYLSDRKLHAVREPGAQPEPLLPKLTNIMQIANGPGTSVILHEGDNKQDDAVKIYTPPSIKVRHITNDQLGTSDITFAVYAEPLDSFIFVTEEGELVRHPATA